MTWRAPSLQGIVGLSLTPAPAPDNGDDDNVVSVICDGGSYRSRRGTRGLDDLWISSCDVISTCPCHVQDTTPYLSGILDRMLRQPLCGHDRGA